MSARWTAALAVLLAGCEQATPELTAEVTPTGLVLHAPAGIDRATLEDPAGVPLTTQRAAAPVETMEIRLRWPARGDYLVRAQTPNGERSLRVPVERIAALQLQVEAPAGQGAVTVEDGAEIALDLPGGVPARVAAALTALQDGPAEICVAETCEARALMAGERLRASAEVAPGAPTTIRASLGDERAAATIAPQEISLEEARDRLTIRDVAFPAEPDGRPDLARPSGRVALPSTWWRRALSATGLGFRPRDTWSPWAWWGVELENSGDRAVNAVVRVQILDEDGAPARAFRPRLREGDDGSSSVQALIRVPAGARATAALPLFVDERLVGADAAASRQWRAQIDLLPLGSAEPLRSRSVPLYVSRGSAAASAGLLAALAAAAAGALLLALRAPRWLRQARTSELMTIALFGALAFLVGAAGRLLGVGVSAALGPFSVLLTGLVDDVLRYALMATLITLLPRPGTASLSALTDWLLSGILLGTFSPTDVLFVGGRVFWLEGALLLAGVTRPTGWLDQRPLARWLRLSLAFGAASICTSATGLVLHVTLYRLFLADWYVLMVLIGPGFLYVALACAAATPFADSLRRIQR